MIITLMTRSSQKLAKSLRFLLKLRFGLMMTDESASSVFCQSRNSTRPFERERVPEFVSRGFLEPVVFPKVGGH